MWYNRNRSAGGQAREGRGAKTGESPGYSSGYGYSPWLVLAGAGTGSSWLVLAAPGHGHLLVALPQPNLAGVH